MINAKEATFLSQKGSEETKSRIEQKIRAACAKGLCQIPHDEDVDACLVYLKSLGFRDDGRSLYWPPA